MQIKQLEAFVAIAERGSYAQAAVELKTTEAALNRLVRQLEKTRPYPLLQRKGRGVGTTSDGELLLEHARGIVQQVERATTEMNLLRKATGGHLRVGFTPSVARIATLQLVKSVRQNFPSVSISVVEGLSADLSDALAEGEIDLAVFFDCNYSQALNKDLIREEPLLLVSAPQSRVPEIISFDQLGEFGLILPGRLHSVRHVVEALAAERSVHLNLSLEVDSISSVRDLIHEGYGHAVLPLTSIEADPLLRAFRISRFRDATPKMSLVLATSRRHGVSSLALKVLPHLKASLQANQGS
jgi:LysR family nitrogen assimilation transcriptional regulator